MIQVAIPKTLAANDTGLIVPPINKFSQMLEAYGVKILNDQKPEINKDKPIYGNMTIKGNLKVNGTIESADEKYFEKKESDQLYLYKPSEVLEDDEYWGLKWVCKEEDIIKNEKNKIFKFRDYLYGHYWELTWDEWWKGSNCVNVCNAKFSTSPNKSGYIEFIAKHTDILAVWIREVIDKELPENHSSINLVQKLYPYLTNWRVIMSDGSERKKNISATCNNDTYTTFTKDNQKYDKCIIAITKPDDEGSLWIYNDSIYVRCDLNIDDNITTLSWDVNKVNAVDYGTMSVYGDNPCLELFNYRRGKRRVFQKLELNVSPNIYIFIDKKLFVQESYGLNPFNVILQQQFYEVEPDPRNCTTLTTDYSIYSSKIIWADNIMSMRRDLNVVGGTVDDLGYEYAVLRQIVAMMQEQQRLQDVYNKYTETLRNVLDVSGTILSVVGTAMMFATALSALNLGSESLSMQTYRTI